MKLKTLFALCVSSISMSAQMGTVKTDSLAAQVNRQQVAIDSARKQIDTIKSDWEYIKRKIARVNSSNPQK